MKIFIWHKWQSSTESSSARFKLWSITPLMDDHHSCHDDDKHNVSRTPSSESVSSPTGKQGKAQVMMSSSWWSSLWHHYYDYDYVIIIISQKQNTQWRKANPMLFGKSAAQLNISCAASTSAMVDMQYQVLLVAWIESHIDMFNISNQYHQYKQKRKVMQ